MDNLTHSLIEAALGQAGLKRKTGLAIPALIIAANLPDIDAGCAIYGIESLSMRRGITHGPIALLVLPVLLAGAIWWFDRWQMRRGKRPEARLPVRFGWLLGLCYIGALTHPLFDWFNNYGIRLLEPFSSQWFYGDTLFIIDPWIIAMLGAGIWFSLRRERESATSWMRPAWFAIAGVLAYVGLNIGISHAAVSRAEVIFAAENRHSDDVLRLVAANAMPVVFWRREVLWRSESVRMGSYFGTVDYDIFSAVAHGPYSIPVYENEGMPRTSGWHIGMDDVRIAQWSKGNPAAQAFLFWSRMPVAELHADRIILRDQRFMNPLTADQFSVTLKPKK